MMHVHMQILYGLDSMPCILESESIQIQIHSCTFTETRD